MDKFIFTSVKRRSNMGKNQDRRDAIKAEEAKWAELHKDMVRELDVHKERLKADQRWADMKNSIKG